MHTILVCAVILALYAAGQWSAVERIKRLGGRPLDLTNRLIVGGFGLVLAAATIFLLFNGGALGVVVGGYLALCVGQCVGYLITKAKS